MNPASHTPPSRKALRLPFVIEKSGLSRASIYRLVKEGKFPAPFKLSERASAWDAQAIDQWLESRMRGAA